jgi:hypothetical protein
VAIFESSLRLFVALPESVIHSLPEIVILFRGDGPPGKISIKKDRFSRIFSEKNAWHTGCLADQRHIALCAAHKGNGKPVARDFETLIFLRSTKSA